jgi:hypothetical protein
MTPDERYTLTQMIKRRLESDERLSDLTLAELRAIMEQIADSTHDLMTIVPPTSR